MPPKKKRHSASSDESLPPPRQSPPETQFVPQEDDDQNMWEAEAILDEDTVKKKFLLKWAGVDSSTGEPWANSWEPKNGVTQVLIDEWKEKKKRDPLLLGRHRREEEKKKKALQAANAAKARAAKAEQVRKRKRTEGSSRSTESPKKARREASRQVSVVSNVSSVVSKDGARPPKRAAKASTTVSTPKDEELATESIAHPSKAALVEDTSFEIHEAVYSEEDQDDSFHPPRSPPRTEAVRRSARAPRSRSVEAGSAIRATHPTSTAAQKASGSNHSAAPSDSAVDPSERAPRHDEDVVDAVKESRNLNSAAVGEVGQVGQTETKRDDMTSNFNADDRGESDVQATRRINTSTPRPRSIPGSPSAGLSKRPHTLLEGARSPNIVITRRSRVIPVPQSAPAPFRPADPETQTTDTDKSIPMSQADPIVDFSSPSHAESSSAARRRAQRPRVSDATTSAPSQPTPSAKLVPKMIDGEVWMTAPDSDEEEAAAAEGAMLALSPGLGPGGADIPPSRAKNGSTGPLADFESLSHANDGKIKQLQAELTKLQAQLAVANRRSSATAAAPAADTRLLEEKDVMIQQLRADVANALATPAPVASTSAVDSALMAAKDAKIAELESTIATLSSSLIAAEKTVSEPSVEAQNLAEGNKFLITQVDEATSRYEQAERELAAARAQIAELSNVSAPVDAAALELLQTEFAAAKADKDALTRKAKNLSDENDFFRQQYQQASNSAVESVRQARELEDEVEKLRSQLKVGLQQRNLHYEAIHAKREAESVKLRATNAILLEQSRRTDDAIRRKAALYDKYRIENEQLREHESAWQDRYAALQERNEELADQVAALRGKQMGVFEDDEEGESDYTEGDAEDDITDDDGPAGSGKRGTIGGFTSSQLGSQISEAGGENPFRTVAAAVLLRNGQADEEQTAEGEVESLVNGEALRCHWRNDQAQCDLAFDRLEDLAHHGRAHAYEREVKVEV